MTNNHSFDRVHGKGAFRRLRSMLDDPGFAYEDIGSKFRLTRQRISQLAKDLGIDARQRQRERTLRREPYLIKKQYPPRIRAVIDKIQRAGMWVTPYISRLSHRANVTRRSQTMIIVNGVLCSIQVRKGHKFAPYAREYARFDVNERTRKAKVALWVIRRDRAMKLYIIPLAHLRKVSFVYIPVDGKSVPGS
jgi:hypothetical protein